MTATITSIAQGFDVGARTYCFHARTSTVAAGSLWTAAAAWWFVSQADVVTKRHHGLELIHQSETTGERCDLLIVDEDGAAEWATPVTTTVATSHDFTAHVSSSGNDSNDGLSSGAPKLTFAAALDVIRANWVTDGDMLLSAVGNFTIGATTGNVVWNHCTTAGGSTALDGRLTIRSAAGSTITLTQTNVGFASLSGTKHGLHLDGLTINGPYTIGGAAHTADMIAYAVPSSGGTGHNLSLRDCTITGSRGGIVMVTSGVSTTEITNGAFDFVSLENVTLDVVSSYHMLGGPARYMGLANCTFGSSNGDSTGSSWRHARAHYVSLTSCTFDRTGDAYQGNIWRLNGGQNSNANDLSQFVSVYDCSIVGAVEGFEIDQPNSTDDQYVADVWFHSCTYDPATIVGINAMLGINNGGGSVGQDITRLRVTCCAGRSNTSNQFFRIATNGSSTTPKIHSVMLDQNTWHQADAAGFFTRDSLFLTCTGNTANFDSASLTILSNYAYTAEDAGGFAPVSFMEVVSASHIATSNYNVAAKNASSDLTWNAADSLATWQGATVHDDNSFEIVSASHNMTNVTAGTFDPRPAADGTPSASLPQMRRGMPGLGYADGDRYLRDASLPDCGAYEFAGGTLMDDPDFTVVIVGLLLSLLQNRNSVSISGATLSSS